MSDTVIRVENLSKRYYIGQARQRHDTLRDALMASLRASTNSFRRDGARNGHRDAIWALKDVSFEVKRGEVVGIIGRNGAGKSTLLKILSRITKPTEGRAVLDGRVGSLLEVGTGFHPELTGRENVYLNGTILGMRKAEVESKFDEIVAFAEVDQFLDTPVKHYSSGMYMRLAFAVAAYLEPEILLVDEVLAVGDAAFQKKCLGRMRDVAEEGRTVLFVSHDVGAIQRLCPRCVLLKNGKLADQGDTASVLGHYSSTDSCRSRPNRWIDVSQRERRGTGAARFVAARYSSLASIAAFEPYSDGQLEFELVIVSDAPRSVVSLSVTIFSQLGTKLLDADTNSLDQVIALEQGHNLVKLRIKELHLNPGVYRLGLWLSDPINDRYSGHAYDQVRDAFDIEVFSIEANKKVTSKAVVSCNVEITEVSSLPDSLSQELCETLGFTRMKRLSSTVDS